MKSIVKTTCHIINPTYLLIVLFIFSSAIVGAQETVIKQELTEKNIYILSQVNEAEVVLRWAPGTANLWEGANAVGYHIDRLKVPVTPPPSPPTFERLTQEPIRPWPAANWERIVEEDDNAAIAYMTIFEERPTPEGDIYLQLRKRDEIKEKSYFFAMTAAGQSAKTSEAMGLRFTDRSIEDQTRYIYRVYSAEVLPNQPMDTAMVMVNTAEFSSQLPPQGLKAVGLENQVVLQWPVAINEADFSAYHLERSAGPSGPFVRLNKAPLLQLNSEDIPEFNEFFKRVDSVGQNYQPHYYRLVGITHFGELSMPSEVVIGMGRDLTPPTSPTIEAAEVLENDRVEVAWNKLNFEPDFAGFIVGRSSQADGPFSPLHNELLPRVVTTFVDNYPNPEGFNFYRVTAVDTAGNASQSFAQYALFLDTFPPSAPIGLTGSIDSNGIVSLSWEPNTEPDLKGYKVYFANAADHPFIQISPELLTEARYVDSINLNTLTEEIFYRVTAVDRGEGYSEYSEFTRLKRPDIIPPSSGAFTAYSVSNDNSVLLEWVPSASHDLLEQRLLRTEGGETRLIATFNASTARFRDTTPEHGQAYTYSLQAIDDDGLLSEQSVPLDIRITDVVRDPEVSRLTATYNEEKGCTEIDWVYANKLMEDRRFVIYRAMPGKSMRSYESVSGTTSFRDYQANTVGEFSYSVMVVSRKGKSPMSSRVSVTVPE